MDKIKFEQKIMTPSELLAEISFLRNGNSGVRIGFTNGCFDIIHRGHVTYLAQSKALVNKLIVALNTDESVKRQNKAPDRPINSLENRMAVIASLQDVDYVTFFDQDTPIDLIELFQPNVLIKGGDWSIDNIVGSRETMDRGGEVHSIPFLYQTSTTKLISKIRHEN